MEEAEKLCESGHYPQALELLPAEHALRGEIYYWTGRAEARRFLRTLPGFEARLAEARCCWQSDLYAEGLSLLRDLPDLPEGRLTRALILICQGQEVEAESEIQLVLPLLSLHRRLRAHYDLGVSYDFREQLEPALKHYSAAVQGWRQISPTHPELFSSLFGLAGIQQKHKLPQVRSTCVEFLQKVAPEDERWPAMAEALALAYLHERQWTELEPVLLQLWERTGRASVAFYLGVTASYLDRPELAQEWLLRAEQGFIQEGQPDKLQHTRQQLAKLGPCQQALEGFTPSAS